jgi:septal ring factor EnvC (AmiA/AmiB activator)
MIETIVIIILAFAFVCATCFCIFNNMKSAEEIARLDTALRKTKTELEDAQSHTYDVLKEWAESMDKHDKAYTELANKNMKLESELELRDIEVERLKGMIDYYKNNTLSLSIDEKKKMEDSTDGDETVSVQG